MTNCLSLLWLMLGSMHGPWTEIPWSARFMALRKAECTVSVSAAMILGCPRSFFTWSQESTEEAGEFGPPQQHHIIHPPTYVLPSRRVCGAKWMAPKKVGAANGLFSYTWNTTRCIWILSHEGATLTSATAPSTSMNLQLVRRTQETLGSTSLPHEVLFGSD